ncbi:Proton-dependent oligopeptide transporter family [Heracleum sosnowskyi]|uniref:Proton-dependent oligopeptide transporter family n=1 Tax=Heracleum sosnowskyi TaxID=360622 RepID=A0AAD8M0H8_9APIA|nr:Proton-dependent oligopeptide transporter family [Heracleum sosnowskyi]
MGTSTVASHEAYGDYNAFSPKKPMKNSWRSAIFIIFVEMAQRFAYYGVSGNLITYLNNVLGMPISSAAKSVNIWHGVSALFPLLGAFVADSYLGRFRTILFSSIIYLTGLVLLTISVSAISLVHRKPIFFSALYILSVGEGGHKPCVQTFAADQFDENVPDEKLAKSSFFNWWYLGIVVGSTAAILVVIYAQEHIGWAIGFGMPMIAVAGALLVFLIGQKKYRRAVPVGSPFTRMMQVMVAAVRKRTASEMHDAQCVCYQDEDSSAPPLARTNQFKFLDKAMIIDETDVLNQKRNKWRLCSVNQVEVVKLVFRLFPIWVSTLMFNVAIAQLSTYFTKQGSTMVRHFKVPPATLQVITGVTILTAVAIYDRLLVPIARKFTKHPSGITMLQRLGIGIFLSMMTMVVAAIVEAKRVGIAKKHGLIDAPKSVVPMSIWWLVPQYMLCGLTDVFAVVGMQEIFYDQVAEEMRSMGAAMYISTTGVGSFMSSGVISIVQIISSRYGNGEGWLTGNNLNRAHLDYFYWLLAGLCGLSLCFYIWVARRFVYKKIECDNDVTSEA